MPVTKSLANVFVGEQLPALTVALQRNDLVRYAGASLDFNPIHWNERVATEVGLPNVIAHGMLTMALAGRLVTDWAGDPAALIEYSTKFTRPVVVPDDAQGATVQLSGIVAELSEDGIARVDITARCGGKTVLGRATALVKLS